MDGVDSRHFLPEVSLSHAQTIVIAARFHRLLSGGSLDYFAPISKTGPDWWTPYDGYLTAEIPGRESRSHLPLLPGGLLPAALRCAGGPGRDFAGA